MNTKRSWGLALVVVSGLARADGPGDNIPEKVRPVPPPGLTLSEADRRALETGLTALGQEVRRLKKDAKAAPLVPDVEIFYQAVRTAFDHGEFFDPPDVTRAQRLLQIGTTRAALLAKGQAPWLAQPGPTVLGYVSALDGSVQPYGLYLPTTFSPQAPHRWRLDMWFHGRGEKLSEVNFIDGATKGAGQFTRPDALLLSPYGRYCNGSKFAGEVDLFEAMADVKRRFPVDEDRVVVRGFSLGGASAWHIGAHFAGDWAAVAPGAGFAETPEFLKVYQNEPTKPTWWEVKLWQLYDAPAYAENFRNVPLVAYSGEIDKQKQAADLMAGVLQKIGLPLTHVIGPGTAHAYHPQAVVTINRLIDAIAAHGRDPAPRRVSVATPTLRYNRQGWVTIDGLGKHWDKALVDAEIVGDGEVALTTKNVTALTLSFAPARCPFSLGRPTTVKLDGQKLAGPPISTDRSWTASFHRAGTRWQAGAVTGGDLRKKHGLQGPIDDAFMAPFMIVTPGSGAWHKDVGAWVEAEQMRAIKEWRRQFRGEPRVKRDSDVSADDIASYNLALWGDPGSNLFIKQIADRLPIKWTRDAIEVGSQRFPADKHALVAVYPNPLNPERYIVLNSGFTFREYDYLNNARQVPKLPDWAVVDLTTPPGSRFPGKIADANFFGEHWELTKGK